MKDLANFYIPAIEPVAGVQYSGFAATLDLMGLNQKNVKLAKQALAPNPPAWCLRTATSILACYETLDEGESLTEDRLFAYAALWKAVDQDPSIYAVKLFVVGSTCLNLGEVKLNRIYAYMTR